MLVDGRFDPTQYSELEIEVAFDDFVTNVKALVADHYATRFPTLKPSPIEVTGGRSYWKIVKVDGHNGSKSVYGFVRKADGAILKAANWNAPYVRGNNYVRGYVMQEQAILAATPYGIIYQRG